MCTYGQGKQTLFQGPQGTPTRAALRATRTVAGMRYSWPPRSGGCTVANATCSSPTQLALIGCAWEGTWVAWR